MKLIYRLQLPGHVFDRARQSDCSEVDEKELDACENDDYDHHQSIGTLQSLHEIVDRSQCDHLLRLAEAARKIGKGGDEIFPVQRRLESKSVAALQSGCIAYLTKPFPAKSLIDPIEPALAGAA
jgi:hypothetical protein